MVFLKVRPVDLANFLHYRPPNLPLSKHKPPAALSVDAFATKVHTANQAVKDPTEDNLDFSFP